ncbi:MFS transporter [Bacillus megaterium]|nr:MFS transporter [Priestia megaterium]
MGAYLPGLFYNETGSYNISFYVSIMILAGAAILNLLLPEPHKVTQKEKIDTHEQLQG